MGDGRMGLVARQFLKVLSSLSRAERCCSPLTCRRTVKGTKEKTPGVSEKGKPPKATSDRSLGKSSKSKQSGGKQRSALNEFMRSTPVLNRFADGTLILGDLVMIAATEVSSERIPYDSMPILTGVFMACWLVAAACLGDYRGDVPTTDNWYLSLLGPAFLAVVDSTLTWALAVTISLAVFSLFVSHGWMDAAPMLEDLGTDNLSPQLEVATAGLITMACWRGIAARLRWYS